MLIEDHAWNGLMETNATNRITTGTYEPRYVAIIGDIVASRRFSPTCRRMVQEKFLALIHSLNREFTAALAAQFTVTSGDEFEGLLTSSSVPEVLPAIIWQVDQAFVELATYNNDDPIEVRTGVGLGTIDTAIGANPNVIDGPAFHAAREAIRLAAKKKSLGGVFAGLMNRWKCCLYPSGCFDGFSYRPETKSISLRVLPLRYFSRISAVRATSQTSGMDSCF